MRLAVAIALALVATTRLAAAQPGLTPVQLPDAEDPSTPRFPAPPPAELAMPLPPPEVPDPKSESTATMLAVGTTAAGFALFAIGVHGGREGSPGMATLGVLSAIIGPSAGHIYAGETGHAVGMTVVRGAGLIAFAVGAIGMTSTTVADCIDCAPTHAHDDKASSERLMWIGGVAFVASTIYDIVDAPRAARRRNDKTKLVTFAPTVVGTSTGIVPAVGINGRF